MFFLLLWLREARKRSGESWGDTRRLEVNDEHSIGESVEEKGAFGARENVQIALVVSSWHISAESDEVRMKSLLARDCANYSMTAILIAEIKVNRNQLIQSYRNRFFNRRMNHLLCVRFNQFLTHTRDT